MKIHYSEFTLLISRLGRTQGKLMSSWCRGYVYRDVCLQRWCTI